MLVSARSGVGWGPRSGFAGRGAGLHQTRRENANQDRACAWSVEKTAVGRHSMPLLRSRRFTRALTPAAFQKGQALIDDQSLRELLLLHAPLRPLPLLPSMRAFHAQDELGLWMALEAASGSRLGAPFFAVAWPGAQALAKAISDGAVAVRGKRVVDLGCGSGIGAVAAALAGAKVVAVDVDPLALGCTRLLAVEHGVSVETRVGDVGDEWVVGDAEVVLAGDVVYNVDLGVAFSASVRVWRAQGRTLVLADSGRPFFDAGDLQQRLLFEVDVPRALEGVSRRVVRVYF